RVVVIDHDPVDRRRLVRALRNESGVDIVGLFDDNTSAVSMIEQEDPDVVFLDNGTDGLQDLTELREMIKPQIVFVTGSSEHAVRSLDAGAIDFVLKPIERGPFRRSVERVRRNLARLGHHPSRFIERLLVKSNGRMVFIRMTDIDSVEAADNYVR